jgi:hypothetical protein
MSQKKYDAQIGRQQSEATRREQEFCMAVLESGEYDDLSDSEWIALCERVADGGQTVRKAAGGTMSSSGSSVKF